MGQLGGRGRASPASSRSSTCSSASPAGSGSRAGSAARSLLLALSILIAFAFAGLGTPCSPCASAAARRCRAFFPLLFVTLFLSSSSLPRNLIQARWFRDVATYNPVSYLIEGMRSLIITGWDAQALALGFGFALALLAIIARAVAARR